MGNWYNLKGVELVIIQNTFVFGFGTMVCKRHKNQMTLYEIWPGIVETGESLDLSSDSPEFGEILFNQVTLTIKPEDIAVIIRELDCIMDKAIKDRVMVFGGYNWDFTRGCYVTVNTVTKWFKSMQKEVAVG